MDKKLLIEYPISKDGRAVKGIWRHTYPDGTVDQSKGWPTVYIRKPIKVSAIQYDGTQEMAEILEKLYDGCYMEWDEGGVFCGLRGYYKENDGTARSNYVGIGDYLVQYSKHGIYYLVDMDEFEKTYEEYEKNNIVG